ncbi:hypothetical protein MNVI_09170 [Mycobacterium noviomagense]|uniref:Uncharacterized protein n=1 Tax=Mycobacterium noviomagense TaxID=459858 RepID=A0A7I7PAJ7_9MYCO|nr:hypothetical protein MNVI_09170 [Mycobacterium noviomagense]
MLAMQTATRLLPSSCRHIRIGGLLRAESQDDRKDDGHGFSRKYRGGGVAGRCCVCRNAIRFEPSRKGPMSRNGT